MILMDGGVGGGDVLVLALMLSSLDLALRNFNNFACNLAISNSASSSSMSLSTSPEGAVSPLTTVEEAGRCVHKGSLLPANCDWARRFDTSAAVDAATACKRSVRARAAPPGTSRGDTDDELFVDKEV